MTTAASRASDARSAAAQITLGADERAEFEQRAACYACPQREVLRAKLVLLAEEGCSNAEIGERLGMSDRAVRRWRRRFLEHRLQGLEDKPRSGRGVILALAGHAIAASEAEASQTSPPAARSRRRRRASGLDCDAVGDPDQGAIGRLPRPRLGSAGPIQQAQPVAAHEQQLQAVVSEL
jgi:hypothetical protein